MARCIHDRSCEPGLAMAVRNLGPIRYAAFRIAPLTVFIGPGNTGKSYAAAAAHSLVRAIGMHAHPSGEDAAVLGAPADRPSLRAPGAPKRPADKWLDAALKSLNAAGIARVPTRASDAAARRCLEGILASSLPGELARNIPRGPRGLARFGCKSLEIGVSTCAHASSLRWGLGSPEARIRAVLPVEQRLVLGADSDCRILCEEPPDDEMPIMYRMSSWTANNLLRRQLPGMFHAPVARRLFPGAPRRSYYLPASRSGVAGAYRALLAGLARSAFAAPGGRAGARTLPGTALDLASSLAEMDGGRGEFFGLGARMERALLGGRVTLRREPGMLEPEIAFEGRGGSVPLSSASSSVAELAPLILYLKHVAQRHSMLVVEEPEARLHPAAQAVLARSIVRMVRTGLRVLVTTHSEVLLEEFSKCLEAARLSNASRKGILGDPMAYLHPAEISAYAFAAGGGGGGITARELSHSEDDGIDEGEFIRVQEALHAETIGIEDAKAELRGDGRRGTRG